MLLNKLSVAEFKGYLRLDNEYVLDAIIECNQQDAISYQQLLSKYGIYSQIKLTNASVCYLMVLDVNSIEISNLIADAYKNYSQ